MPDEGDDQAAEAAAEGGEGEGNDEAGLTAAEREEVVQQLRVQLSSMVDEHREQLQSVFEQLGLPAGDLTLGDDDSSTDGSKQQKQLTGS